MGQPFSDPDRIGSVYTEEDPEDFIFLGPGFDLVQAIMLSFCTKAAFHTGCPFFTELRCYNLPLILILTGPSFPLEVRDDLLAGAPLTVRVTSIDIIRRYVSDLAEQGTAVPD